MPKKPKPKPKKKIIRRAKVKKRALKKRRPAPKKRRPAPKKKPVPKVKEKILGIVTHYFPKVRAGVIKLKMPLLVGQTIKIKGHTTDFTQTITSMQIDHVPVTQAKRGQEIGLLVNSRVRRNDKVIPVE